MEKGDVLGGRYELLAPLAEGASGTVWSARDGDEGDEVAIKAVSLEQAGWRAEVRDRFLQEARLLALAPHRHLVAVRGFGETEDGHLYLVLEMLRGETLAERIARPPQLGWKEATAIALAIARGLEALHAQRIVHRDLKPSNVILHRAAAEAEAVPKIIDLGISKARAAALDPVLRATLTATGQVLGTPQYMSYEQALGDRDIDARSDIWSLGCLLHEMLAGRPPFVAPNVNAILAAIRRGNPPSLRAAAPDVPAALEAVTVRCLRRDREARFPDSASLVQALEQLTSSRARPYLVPLAAVVAVAGLSALLAMALREPPPLTAPSPASASASASASATTAALEPTTPAPAAADPAPPPSEPVAPAPAPSPRPTRPRPPPATRINDAGF